jgi:hypothetical protein
MVVRIGVETYLEKLGLELSKSKNNSLLTTSKLKTILPDPFSWKSVCSPLNAKP